MSARLALLCGATLTLLTSAQALAQDQPCRGSNTDSLISARRARRALEDYERVSAQFMRDIELLNEATREQDIANPPRVRVYGGPVLDMSLWPELDTCTSQGRWSGDMTSFRLGGVFGVDELKWGLGLRFYLVEASDSLTAKLPGWQAPASDPSATRPQLRANQRQRTRALRLQLSPWFALTIAQLSDELSSSSLTLNDQTEVTFTQRQQEVTGDKLILRAEVPRLRGAFDVILAGEDQTLETLYFNLDAIPLPATPLELTTHAGYLRDEAQTYAALGLSWVRPLTQRDTLEMIPNQSVYRMRSSTTHRIGFDSALELNDPGLRWARASTRLDYKFNQNDEDPLQSFIIGQPYLIAGLYWEGSVFHGRYMREQTDTSWAFGTTGGGYAGFGFRAMSLFIDVGVGLNRPETLSRNVQTVNRGEGMIKMGWRVGW